ncbi:sortase [Streptomyces luteireticuli]|uniref:sortase n=1 Tax=Streptomyces luteireticuli TaxID=173858 RepID=UPI003556C37D
MPETNSDHTTGRPGPRSGDEAGTPSTPSARRPTKRQVMIGGAVAAAAAIGITAACWPQAADSEDHHHARPRAAAPASGAPSAHGRTPDPLTAASDAPLGGDPSVLDSSSKAADDAERTLSTWGSSNPASTADDHAVGDRPAQGSGGSIHEIIRIPALGKNWAQPVYEGVGDQQLRAGIGHFPKTEKAGQIGNFALAGHRSGVSDPAFRNIDNITAGSQVIVTTASRITYTYTVTTVRTVDPSDVNVIAQVPGHPGATPTKPKLTIVTCWPANGHSRRVVVEADLTASQGGAP